MLATAIDLLHDLLRVTVGAYTDSAHRSQIPKPWHWPRPHERRAKKPFSWRAIARQMRG